MDVVGRQRSGEQSEDQLAHFVDLEVVARLDGGAAGVGRGEPLEPVLPAAEPATREVGDQLLQAPRRLEAGMRIRRGVYDDAPARRGLDLESDAGEQLAMRLDRL